MLSYSSLLTYIDNIDTTARSLSDRTIFVSIDNYKALALDAAMNSSYCPPMATYATITLMTNHGQFSIRASVFLLDDAIVIGQREHDDYVCRKELLGDV
jgi:hypothetical protein